MARHCYCKRFEDRNEKVICFLLPFLAGQWHDIFLMSFQFFADIREYVHNSRLIACVTGWKKGTNSTLEVFHMLALLGRSSHLCIKFY
jgi:hypothetical protein